MMLYKGFLVLKMVLRLKLLVELPEMGHALLFFFGSLPHTCERLPAKHKSEDHGLPDLTFSKHKRYWILPGWNNLFSRQRRVKFDSYVLKLILCLTEFNVVLVSIYFKHQTGASWPRLVNYWKHVTVLKSRYQDNHSIQPYFRSPSMRNFFETRFLFIETPFAMFDLCKLYSDFYTASTKFV